MDDQLQSDIELLFRLKNNIPLSRSNIKRLESIKEKIAYEKETNTIREICAYEYSDIYKAGCIIL
tara:strand:- start:361 stop:555 length:195 start_codon:yes stop_codon:yes gene_type:complete